MNFSDKAITKKDLINSYKQTIEIKKSSINYWTNKGDERRVKIITASMEKLKQYIEELK
jgi:hypothetical protein